MGLIWLWLGVAVFVLLAGPMFALLAWNRYESKRDPDHWENYLR